ncbi:alkaline phosphatase [Nesterenkonia alba]|uniref:alkaline phosphatase n=1 Tax=Nesterenkonia alba TaxID=515814 RepID=UPI0003B6CDD9|nr:alkaline phosphatase [Nesterenkonia alba]
MTFLRSARLGLAATVAGTFAATSFAAAPATADEASAGPENIIVMIADGMGYNHVDAASLFQHGQSNWQVDVDPETGEIDYQDGYGETPSQVYETYSVQLGMSHHSLNSPVYDGEAAWGDFDWVREDPTDSAASGTALATGEKTLNGYLGVDADGNPIQNVAQFAQETGRAAGVVSDVPFGHATPASWGAHVASRSANHEIAEQMIYGDLDVIIGAGHPLYDNDSQPREADWEWMTEEHYADLQNGETGFSFAEDNAGILDVASGANVPERFFGLAPVASTLQYNRSSLEETEPRRDAGREDGVPLEEGQSPLPFEAERNDVVDLADMTSAALNVLSQNENGFFTMIEAGAVDWAGHANSTAGNIEEMIAFNEAVETVHTWVETNSSWDETLVIVTADHETGYLEGPDGDPEWTTMTGEQGQLPVDGWYSGDHTQHLVPLFAHGAGAEQFHSYIQGEDPVRGAYVDNTNVAHIAFDLWADDADPDNGEPGETVPPAEVSVSPDEVAPGDTVEVTGSGFAADEQVRIELNPELGTTEADDDGEIATEVTIPEDTEEGPHELTATGEDSGATGSAEITVTAGEGDGTTSPSPTEDATETEEPTESPSPTGDAEPTEDSTETSSPQPTEPAGGDDTKQGPRLADTGATIAGVAIGALLLLSAGIFLVMRNRRRRAGTSA